MAVVPRKQPRGTVRRVRFLSPCRKPARVIRVSTQCFCHVQARSAHRQPLSVLLGGLFNDAFARQGFASRELATRWAEIAGPEIAAHSEPIKIQWPRPIEGQPPEPATLVLRVEGPVALEIQHASDIILERVNRFFGWNAVGKLALRQAPLSQAPARKPPPGPDPAAVKRVAETLASVEDEGLRTALARLGAAIKRN